MLNKEYVALALVSVQIIVMSTAAEPSTLVIKISFIIAVKLVGQVYTTVRSVLDRAAPTFLKRPITKQP